MASRVGAELVDEDELRDEFRAAVAVTPQHRLVLVAHHEAV